VGELVQRPGGVAQPPGQIADPPVRLGGQPGHGDAQGQREASALVDEVLRLPWFVGEPFGAQGSVEEFDRTIGGQ
jgi:hypothetical protein